jgi:hypothetical protein
MLVFLSIINHLPKELSQNGLNIQKLNLYLKERWKILHLQLQGNFVTDIIFQNICATHIQEGNWFLKL